MQLSVMILTLTGIALLCLLLGIAIKHWKWYWVISGYNTMSKEKKAQVDTEGLGRFIGNGLYVLSVILLVGAWLSANGFHTAFLILMIATGIMFPAFMIKAQKFDPSAWNNDGSMKMSVKIIIGILILTFAFVGALIGYGMLPPNVEVHQDRVTVSGMYGTSIAGENISGLELVETIPAIRRKTGGMDAGPVRKGWFQLENGETALLFINLDSPPYIQFRDEHRLVLINYRDPERTEDLCNEMRTLLK